MIGVERKPPVQRALGPQLVDHREDVEGVGPVKIADHSGS